MEAKSKMVSKNNEKLNKKIVEEIENADVANDEELQSPKNVKHNKKFGLAYLSKKADKTSKGKSDDKNLSHVSKVAISKSEQGQGNVSSDQTKSENNEDIDNFEEENQNDEISGMVSQGLSSIGSKVANKLFNKNSEKSISLSISLGSDGEGNNAGGDIALRCLNAVANSEITISIGQSLENETSFSIKSSSNDTTTKDKLQEKSVAANANQESEKGLNEEEPKNISLSTENGEILTDSESDIVDGPNEGDENCDTKESQDEKKNKRFGLAFFSKKSAKTKKNQNAPEVSDVSSSQSGPIVDNVSLDQTKSENNEDIDNLEEENQEDEISGLVSQGLSSIGSKLVNKLFNKNSEKSISLSISLGSDGEGNNSGEDIASLCLNAVANSEINISIGQSLENETSFSIKSSSNDTTTEDKLQETSVALIANQGSKNGKGLIDSSGTNENRKALKESESDIVDGSNEVDEINDTKEYKDDKNAKKSIKFGLAYFSKKGVKKNEPAKGKSDNL